MDIKKVKKNQNKLIRSMKKLGLQRTRISVMRSLLNSLFEHKGEYDSYLDFYKKFIDSDGFYSNKKKYRETRYALRRIWAFDEYDELPTVKGGKLSTSAMHSNTMELNDTFRNLVTLYRTAESKRQKSPKSINNECSILSTFLLEMQNAGAKDLSDITTRMAGSFFYEKNRQIRSSAYANRLKYILNIVVEQTGDRLSFQIPFVKKREKVFKPFDEDFLNNVKHSINTDGSQCSLRDRAIIALSAYTGMRGSDIASLKIEDIDWGRDVITIIQSKTQQQLILPLTALIGNAIFDYIKSKKAIVRKGEYLFTKDIDDAEPMDNSAIGGVISRFLSKFEDSDFSPGLRAFRHNVASSLLRNGVTPATISSILGHLSPYSLNPYIDMDYQHLRDCCLDISIFPIRKEVYDI